MKRMMVAALAALMMTMPAALAAEQGWRDAGEASFYGDEMAGRRTANGETCDPDQLTAAHRTLPFGTLVRVNLAGDDRSVVVRINDRGPFRAGRVIDLSRAAARAIGLERRGHGAVELSLAD